MDNGTDGTDGTDARCQLSPEQTRRACDPAQLAFATTDDLPEPQELPGQQRAQEAIAFALEMGDEGYHLYVSGEPGCGRLTAALKAVRAKAIARAAPADCCYVYHFERPDEPRGISLPAGGAEDFARRVDDFVGACRRELRRAFGGDTYRQQRDAVLKGLTARHRSIMEHLQREGLAHGFLIQPMPDGLATVALAPARERTTAPADAGHAQPQPGRPAQSEDLEPLTPQQFAALSEVERERIGAERDLVAELIAAALPRLEALQEEARERLRELDGTLAHKAVGRLTEGLVALYPDNPRVVDYVRHLGNDIATHADVLAGIVTETGAGPAGDTSPGSSEPGAEDSVADGARSGARSERETNAAEPNQPDGLPFDADGEGAAHERPALATLLRRYRVNVLVAHHTDDHAPVVQELNPTYPNLLGHVEFGLRGGLPFTDHLLIQAGAFHRANGGFLILLARDLLSRPRSWEALKRALRFGVIGIDSDGELPTMPASASLRPEPIAAHMKVLLIGEPAIFDALMLLDPEFPELFTVRAEFETAVARTPEAERFYAQFAGQVAREASVPGLTPGAVALLVEEGSRWAQDQERVAADLRGLRRLIVEAGQRARDAGAPATAREHLAGAIAASGRRMGLVSDKLDDLIDRRVIMIDTCGSVVGQVNGLTVMSAAGYTFGKPARITSRTAPGLAGIINLERETAMSGPAHSKGILILAGYLAGRFARDFPLSLAGSICFEQIYGQIEGDSASSAELYALLSSLSGIPIKQALAVTGSVNQRGEIQPVGAVTEKVEGFFHVCARRGLTGEQGVIIPRANVRDLMLREEVVEAIRGGRFHLYAVETVDEGIELLTGVPAGAEDEAGGFPAGTINAGVSQTLRLYAQHMRNFAPVAATRSDGNSPAAPVPAGAPRNAILSTKLATGKRVTSR